MRSRLGLMEAAVSFFSPSIPQTLPGLFAEDQAVLVFWGVFRCCLPCCPCALWFVGCARGWQAARRLCVRPAAGGHELAPPSCRVEMHADRNHVLIY